MLFLVLLMKEKIKSFLKDHNKVVLSISVVLILSLVYAEFVLSLSILAFLLYGIYSWIKKEKRDFNAFPHFVSWIKQGQRLPLIVLTLMFFYPLTSFFYSEDLTQFWTLIRIRIPFLLFVLPFLFIPPISKNTYTKIHYVLIVGMTFSCLLVLINYVLDYEVINSALSRGKTIPTPIHHIRFSLLVSLAASIGIYYILEYYRRKPLQIKWWIFGSTVFLIISLHILSVRSGLLVFYSSSLFLLLRYMYLQKQIVKGVILISILFLLPMIAFYTVPSFKNKIDYMQWDLQMLRSGNLGEYSDSQRFRSLYIGMKIACENPVFGVGGGDLRKTVGKMFSARYGIKDKKIKPHNQLVSIFASTGILGLVILLFSFFLPFFYKDNYSRPQLIVFGIVFFLSFLVENTIDGAVGTAMYLFFLLINLNYLTGKNNEDRIDTILS